MSVLQDFMEILTGHFNNQEQMEALQKQGITDFPYAEHVNTACNDKITGLPQDFAGVFMVEESYYTTSGKTHASPHLFLFTEAEGEVTLTSYDIPAGQDKNTFSYATMQPVAYADLKASTKFTPAVYRCKDGVWEGGSVSMFTPVLKFTLFERFSAEKLEVSESMEMNGKRTFGFDEPIVYKRK